MNSTAVINYPPADKKPNYKVKGGALRYQRRFATITITPIMIYMIIFALFPILMVVVMSFFDYTPIRQGSGFMGLGGDNPFIGFENYKNLLFSSNTAASIFRKAFVTTIIFTVLYVPLNLIVTLPLAILVESVHDKVKGLFRTIYFMPAISSTVVVGLIWGIIYAPQGGLLNLLMHGLGLPSRAWLTDPRAFVFGIPVPLIAIMIALLWQEFGYNLVIFISALQGIPQEFRDAARVDGANSWHEFWKITLPLLQPTLLLVCVLSVISTLQQFVIFQLLTHGGPNYETYNLVLDLYESAFRYQSMGWGAAISMVLFALTGIVTAVQFRLLRVKWEY